MFKKERGKLACVRLERLQIISEAPRRKLCGKPYDGKLSRTVLREASRSNPLRPTLQLMQSFIKLLDSGYIINWREAFNFRVTKFSDINEKIIPFFKKYPVRGVKAEDFKD